MIENTKNLKLNNQKFLTWWYVYILRSLKDKKWYTGYTDNLRKRFVDHNKGLVYSSRKRRPFSLIYYEASLDERDAKMREIYLKSGMGKRYVRNRLKFYFNKNF